MIISLAFASVNSYFSIAELMVIQDFTDMQELESIISNWSKATGVAAAAVSDDGKYIHLRQSLSPFYEMPLRPVLSEEPAHRSPIPFFYRLQSGRPQNQKVLDQRENRRIEQN